MPTFSQRWPNINSQHNANANESDQLPTLAQHQHVIWVGWSDQLDPLVALKHGPYTQGYATSAQGWFNACYGRQKIKGEIKLDYITLSPTPVVPHLSSINHGDVTHVRLLSNHAYSARELTVNQRDSERYPICTHTDSTINTRSTTLFSHTARLAFLRYTVAWSVMYVWSVVPATPVNEPACPSFCLAIAPIGHTQLPFGCFQFCHNEFLISLHSTYHVGPAMEEGYSRSSTLQASFAGAWRRSSAALRQAARPGARRRAVMIRLLVPC